MAYLLHRLNEQDEWCRQELPEAGAVLLQPEAGPAKGIAVTTVDTHIEVNDMPGALALIVPWVRAGQVRHVHLKFIEEAYRNAEPMPLASLAVLRNRDCLAYRSDGAVYRVFYDAFTRPQVHAYAGEPLDCVYCRQPLAPGMFAVECPGCALFFHQTDEGGCWLASDRCPNCGHPTALDQNPTWIPQGIDDRVGEDSDGLF